MALTAAIDLQAKPQEVLARWPSELNTAVGQPRDLSHTSRYFRDAALHIWPVALHS